MARKDFFDNINSVINDWKNTSFTFFPKTYVPGLDDKDLTYGNGEEKKGVEINTCVLFVDIRNSVQLTKDKQVRTMGKVYSVFTHCVLLAAQYDGGYVRNIIGDRVMVVFPPEDCFKKAVFCAITINHIASLINKKFDNFEFKCGIGIDYGKLSVMKVGIQKKGAENDDNKGLVWVGYPANFASRLTDCANKEFTDVVYKVDGQFYEYNYFNNPYFGRQSGWYRKTKEFTAEEFASNIAYSAFGQCLSFKLCTQIYSIDREEKKYTYNNILLSDKVYQEYTKALPDAKDIKNGWWKKQTRKIRDIDFDVWGADLTWSLD
ncbi:adenylate/guanylate cyclase domain-containing protein [Xylanibacter ruminicola]|uniref:Adenylate and Guanylate cyclase catalytic domain-containing protein n=1 Tax=Xylanibacter ruminicola TaxID=839 RepID=A0A1M6R206_XYLRU|nr:adenylate/guanylate cyclase domain-containing protein [Xylanibacter ruminicola]SHK26388.1 Adenylate and Guanylate cyclase catalytic domain-containing protein [Xylanibacter ruminicola]